MRPKVVDLETALGLVPDGATLGVGGILLLRKPVRLLLALARAGRRRLSLHTFLGSVDAEILAASGAIDEAHIGYVGFEQLGFAPAFDRAVAAGQVRVHEHTEMTFVGGLRAALAGLPFLPVRGGTGSQVVAELGLRTVTCPYTGQTLVAARALAPDVTVLHAEMADTAGTVAGPERPDFLFDLDANLARAATTVVVSVERVVPPEELRRSGRRPLLFGHEVDAVVELPGGARPTALPGCYRADRAAVRAYLDRAATGPAGTEPEAALQELVS